MGLMLTRKNILAVMLVLLLSVVLMPGAAFAADDKINIESPTESSPVSVQAGDTVTIDYEYDNLNFVLFDYKAIISINTNPVAEVTDENVLLYTQENIKIPDNATPGKYDVTVKLQRKPHSGGSYKEVDTDSEKNAIIVVDTTPPVLTLPSDMVVEATGSNGAVVNFEATAVDDADGTVAVVCTPQSGSIFPVGDTTVTCTATDAAGNAANGTFKITVQDTTKPVLTLPADMVVEATGPTGAVVDFTATATDLVDGTVAVVCDPESGSVFPLGTKTVICTATDKAGNKAEGTFTITVQDTTPPELNLPADIVVKATKPDGVAVKFAVTATDLVDGPVPVTCSHKSGSIFAIGTTVVTCTAIDSKGKVAEGSFSITVESGKNKSGGRNK